MQACQSSAFSHQSLYKISMLASARWTDVETHTNPHMMHTVSFCTIATRRSHHIWRAALLWWQCADLNNKKTDSEKVQNDWSFRNTKNKQTQAVRRTTSSLNATALPVLRPLSSFNLNVDLVALATTLAPNAKRTPSRSSRSCREICM